MPVSLMAAIAGVVFLGLAMGLLFGSTAMLKQFGLDSAPAASVMAHRLGATFAGMSALLFLTIVLEPEMAIMVGFAAIAGFLAVLGLIELRIGRVSTGIFVAIGTEFALMVGFLSTLWS